MGIIAWAVQWRAVATSDEESVLRQVYLYGFTFIGGASLSLWGAAATIFIVIAQLVGADNTTTAVAYFRQFILPFVGLLIGLALLAYHWSILRRDAARRSPSLTPLSEPPARQAHLSITFKYIMSAVGLIALVPGLMALLMALLDPLVNDNLFASNNEQEEFLAVALTMIIVGAPLWSVFWWRVLHADPRSLVRRIYLYVALIALGGTWLFTLVALLAAVLTEILGQGSGFLDDTLVPSLSIVVPRRRFLRLPCHHPPRRLPPRSPCHSERSRGIQSRDCGTNPRPCPPHHPRPAVHPPRLETPTSLTAQAGTRLTQGSLTDPKPERASRTKLTNQSWIASLKIFDTLGMHGYRCS